MISLLLLAIGAYFAILDCYLVWHRLQNCIKNILSLLLPVYQEFEIYHDIIIGGCDTNELLDRMKSTFQRLREKNLTINYKKCEFLKAPETSQFTYFILFEVDMLYEFTYGQTSVNYGTI